MTRRWSLVTLLSVMAMGCARRELPTHPSEAVHPAPALAPRALAVLDHHCGECHDNLAARLREGSSFALQAALRVAAYEMPPAGPELPKASRLEVIRVLCDAGAQRPDVCFRWYAHENEGPRLLPSRALLRVFAAVGFNESNEPSEVQAMLSMMDSTPLASRVHRLDPTVELLRILDAIERCPSPEGAGHAGFTACARTLLSSEQVTFPEAIQPHSAGEP